MSNTISVNCDDSTCLSDASYEPDNNQLTVTYRGTESTYRYDGVMESEFHPFATSDSKGQSLMGIIEGKAYEQM